MLRAVIAADSDALIPSINAGQVASTARCFPIPTPTLPLKGREKILGTLPPSRRRALFTLLPLQGGGWEGDGVFWWLSRRSSHRLRPIPTPSHPIANVAFATFPLKGREKADAHAIALGKQGRLIQAAFDVVRNPCPIHARSHTRTDPDGCARRVFRR